MKDESRPKKLAIEPENDGEANLDHKLRMEFRNRVSDDKSHSDYNALKDLTNAVLGIDL